MAEDPFDNRLEDYLNRGLRAAVGSVPVVGPTLGEFFGFVVGDPAQERRDDFMRETLERLIRLEKEHEALRPENLRKNQAFQATFIEAAQASIRTASDEKREMLRNAVLNSAVYTLDETVRHMFMRFIDQLTPLHVALLRLFDDVQANPNARAVADRLMAGGLDQVVSAAIPQLAGQRELSDALVRDLKAMGLADIPLHTTMSSNGLLARRTTEFGRQFLRFISDPTKP